MKEWDVIVIGAGHAGAEAALASARLGQNTLLLTNNISRISYMSCNPSIGGLGKGHMVKEIDILGGEMALAADASCIQFKKLNARKGPAVRGTRFQTDKDIYSSYMSKAVQSRPNLTVMEAEVKELILNGGLCGGVRLQDGSEIPSLAVVVTTGTFMRGMMHMGLEQTPGGRVGDKQTVGISDQLAAKGFKVRRLKTGTPARLSKKSIDWSKTNPQYGDERYDAFSLRSPRTAHLPQVACHLTYTNERTHQIIKDNLHLSPMYCGHIEGVGPRYCPSIEDKVVRFFDKPEHQSFLEPETLNGDLIYLQGISTSLPANVQLEFLKTIPGLENVDVVRYGYAVEYDFFEPTQVFKTLETKAIQNLYFAGQINGTSGYEEAAAQGLMAGANAALKLLGKDPLILGREEAYIGVLIDDLVTKGTIEPYRMMTARAEHRLVLREDNVLNRLGDKAASFGLVDNATLALYDEVKSSRARLRASLATTVITPTEASILSLKKIGTGPISKPNTLEEILRRPEVSISQLAEFSIDVSSDERISDPVEIEIKYEGYIRRQQELIDQAQKMERLELPEPMDYQMVRGLSREEIEKLSNVRPRTLGQAGRISGVNPSAIQALLVHLKGKKIIPRSGAKLGFQ